MTHITALKLPLNHREECEEIYGILLSEMVLTRIQYFKIFNLASTWTFLLLYGENKINRWVKSWRCRPSHTNLESQIDICLLEILLQPLYDNEIWDAKGLQRCWGNDESSCTIQGSSLSSPLATVHYIWVTVLILGNLVWPC